MNQYHLLLPILLLMSWSQSYTQSLPDHRWQDRLIVILTTEQDHPLLERQLTILNEQVQSLKERRLLLYHVTPEAYRLVFPGANAWEVAQRPYEELKATNASFEIMLIGLDGGVKLRRTELVAGETLFDLIDQMPMRRAEMRKN